jgi:hypothetical protein
MLYLTGPTQLSDNTLSNSREAEPFHLSAVHFNAICGRNTKIAASGWRPLRTLSGVGPKGRQLRNAMNGGCARGWADWTDGRSVGRSNPTTQGQCLVTHLRRPSPEQVDAFHGRSPTVDAEQQNNKTAPRKNKLYARRLPSRSFFRRSSLLRTWFRQQRRYVDRERAASGQRGAPFKQAYP